MNLCSLCKLNKTLIQAHVIPKWAFKYLYPERPDGDNRSLVLVGKNIKEVKRPIGPYDPNILCKECDSFLGKFDEYGKKILLDSQFEVKSTESYIIKNIDFVKLRLFLLSVIWRAAISNREEFIRVSLGPYKEQLRKIFFDCKNGIFSPGIGSYHFVIAKYDVGELPPNVVNKNVQIPHVQKIDGINTAILYLPRGLKIFIKMDKRNFTGPINLLANYHQEGLIIAKLGDYSESDEFKSMAEVVKSNGRLFT